MIAAQGRRARRVLVLSPWGAGGGYSGPVTFLNRLFGAVHESAPEVALEVLYRDRGAELVPAWAASTTALGGGHGAAFGVRQQLAWGWRAARALRATDAGTLVHLHGVYLANLVAAFALPAGRTALLPVLEHGDLVPAGPRLAAALKTRLLRRVVGRARVGFALTRGIRDELVALGMPAERIVPLGNAVDEAAFAPAGRTAPRPGAVRLGFVGKLGAIKRPQLLLDTVARLRADGLDATGVFVGPFESAAFEAGFRRRVAELGLEAHVTLAGLRDDVASALREEMDVFVLPSSSEGMPGALAEAMMTGLPAAVTDVGAMGDTVLASDGGVIVEPDGDRIAAAVRGMLGDGGGADGWLEYSRRAADYARRAFGSRAVAAAYLAGAGLGTASAASTLPAAPAGEPRPAEELRA